MNVPLLVSANSLRKRNRKDAWEWRGWRYNIPDLDGTDLALDSAGFVAHAHYGGFLWTVEDYLDLAASRDWAFWAQMDACVEPEIARDREQVQARLKETIRLWDECYEGSVRRGIKPPMPVVQGWTPEDYLWSIEQLKQRGVFDWCRLVGIGSVCRREIFGEAGVM